MTISTSPTPQIQLLQAVRKNDLAAAREFLRQDASIIHVSSTERGRKPLHLAALAGHAEMVQLLLGFGADPTREDDDHNLALHLACHNRHASAIDLLIRDGRTDVNQLTGSDMTLLHFAAFGGHAWMLSRLLDVGADASIVCVFGEDMLNVTPYDMAEMKQHTDIMSLLRNHQHQQETFHRTYAQGSLDEKAVSTLLRMRKGWEHLQEIHARFPLSKDFFFSSVQGNPAPILRAVECYSAPTLIHFLWEIGEPLTPDDLLESNGSPNPLLKSIIEHHALGDLMTEKNWQGQSRQAFIKVWNAIPAKERWQAPHFHRLQTTLGRLEQTKSQGRG